jgi:hypothetical protein
MFRSSSRPLSRDTTTAVTASGLPSELGDSSAVGREEVLGSYFFSFSYVSLNSSIKCELIILSRISSAVIFV